MLQKSMAVDNNLPWSLLVYMSHTQILLNSNNNVKIARTMSKEQIIARHRFELVRNFNDRWRANLFVVSNRTETRSVDAGVFADHSWSAETNVTLLTGGPDIEMWTTSDIYNSIKKYRFTLHTLVRHLSDFWRVIYSQWATKEPTQAAIAGVFADDSFEWTLPHFLMKLLT